MHTHIHVHTCIFTNAHIHTDTHVHMHIHTYMHIQKYIQAHTHTDTHTQSYRPSLYEVAGAETESSAGFCGTVLRIPYEATTDFTFKPAGEATVQRIILLYS